MSIYRKTRLILALLTLISIPLFMIGHARADDVYEENDERLTAWHPGYDWEGMWLSDIQGLANQFDDDWYQIDVDPGSTLIQVDCRFTHAEGDIDISLYNPSGSFVAGSNSETDNEFISYSTSISGTFYILVHYGNAGNTYDLWWEDVKEDAYEENDTLETAWHPGYDWERTWLFDFNGNGHQADDDWYRIDVDPGSDHVQVDCRFIHAEGDIDIALYDSSGTLVAVSESSTDDEFIDQTVSSSGTYYIKVYKGNAENAYNLWWNDIREDAYEENETLETAWHPGYDWEGMWLSAIHGLATQTDADWYRIDVDPGSERVQMECRFTHAGGDIDMALYDSSGNLLAVSNSITDNESIDYTVSSSGTYYILVYCSNVGNSYDLRWGMPFEIVVAGLGSLPPSGGWSEAFTKNYSHKDWLRVGWKSYNSVNGEARVATGDIDGDGKDEVILGLGPVPGDSSMPGGWFQILEDNYTPLAWGRINWSAYNSANGESWPACGDVDGDGRDEIIIGLGTYPAAGGYVEIFDYDAGSVTHAAWVRVNWCAYNTANGETHPACGDIDGDGRDEIIIGLGSAAGGWFEVFDDALGSYAHLAWPRVQWWSYNSANGETRPACGDVDGDGRDEIVVGLGQGARGHLEVFDDASAGYGHLAWPRVLWGTYNSANGETRPACGDVDGDGLDEIVVGLGQGARGYLEVFDDASAGYAHLAWPRIQWANYCSARGETWPALKK